MPTVFPVCDKDLDLVFLVDESRSLGTINEARVKGYISRQLDHLDVGFGKTHIGLASYASFALNADAARSQFNLGELYNRDALRAGVNGITFAGVSTYLDNGLRFVRTHMFNETSGARPRSDKVTRAVVVITDGYYDEGHDPFEEARLLMADGVVIHAVAIGNEPYRWDAQLIDRLSMNSSGFRSLHQRVALQSSTLLELDPDSSDPFSLSYIQNFLADSTADYADFANLDSADFVFHMFQQICPICHPDLVMNCRSRVETAGCGSGSEIDNFCERTCCVPSDPPTTAPTVLSDFVRLNGVPETFHKGDFKHGLMPITVTYATSAATSVDLIPVVRNVATGNTVGLLDGRRTIALNTLDGLPSSGSTEVTLRFLSQMQDGTYDVTVYLTPAGGGWSNRLSSIPVVRARFTTVNEFVRFCDQAHYGATGICREATAATFPAFIYPWTPRSQDQLAVAVMYKSVSPVKFAIQVRCTNRVANPTKCLGQPVYVVNPLTPQTAIAGEGVVMLNVQLMSYTMSGIEYSLDVAMGRYNADYTWAETRDRTARAPLAVPQNPARQPGAANSPVLSETSLSVVTDPAKSTTNPADASTGSGAGATGDAVWVVAAVFLLGTVAAILAVMKYRRSRAIYNSSRVQRIDGPVEGSSLGEFSF
jgi:hypothetical protein